MPIVPADLPSDVAALQAMIAAQAAEIAAQKTELSTARSGIIEQRFEIEALKARLARLLRVTFGRSSEKLRARVEQLELTLADIDELLAETCPEDPDAAAAEASKLADVRKPVRRPLPEALPRDVVEHAAPCVWPACGGALRKLGEDVTEILDYVPGSFRVIRHVRPKLSCRACETIAQAPAPSLPIRRGRAGAGLLAHVLVAKYGDHLPLHRQAEIYAREDIDLPRSTLADMVGQTARLVRPLVDALARHVMAGERVHADDTVVPVLEPGLGRTRTARFWTPASAGQALRPRRSAIRRAGSAGGALPVFAGPQGGAPTGASAGLPRHPAGGRICRVCRPLRRRPRDRGGLHGPRPAQVLGCA